MQSTGELGYIHTGVESTAQAGVPWRTIRLQPNAAADTADVPDWALLDVFTVPVSVPAAGSSVFRPHDDASGGKVNINAEIYPFQLSRTAPLTAVLQGARNHSANAASVVSPEQAQTLATNILSRTLAASGKPYGKEDAFDSPGEIVEIAGIADGGEESEELVRSIAAQITARSNVFCIYVIGQSLSPPDGKVTGEQRLRFIVERYLDGGEIKFRKIHSKLLTQ